MLSFKNIGIKAAFFGLFLLPFFLAAQSSMGKDIEYVYLGTSGGNNQYKVTVRLFWNCWNFVSGTANAAPPVSVTLKAVGCAVNTTFTLNPDSSDTNYPNRWGIGNTPLCSAAETQGSCGWTGSGNPPFQGTRTFPYSATISLPTGCSQIYLGVDDCCRSADVSNIVNPTVSQSAVRAVVNTTLQNSSVHFMDYFREVFVCQNSLNNISYGGTDSNGDSLVYSLVTPLQGTVPPYTNATFSVGYTAANPVKTIGAFGFNSANGEMTFTPSTVEQDVIAVRADEYRNGVLVGSTMREITLGVSNCFAANPVFHDLEVQNATLTSPTSVSICPNTSATFRMLITDPNQRNLHVGLSDLDASPQIRDSIMQFQLQPVGSSPVDSLYMIFHLTSTLADTGCYWLWLRIENDDCPVTGMTSQAYQICVKQKVTVSPHSALYCGTPVQLTASGGTNFLWTPTINTLNTNTLTPLVSPTISTRYTFSSTCGTDTARVVPVNIFNADAGAGGNICAAQQLQLQASADNVYPNYTIQWTPAAGLSNTAIFNPVASPAQSTTYIATITAPNGCSRSDSVRVNVTGVSPTVYAAASPDSVCPGEAVTLTGSAGPSFCGTPAQTCTGQATTEDISFAGSVFPQPQSNTEYPSPYGNYYASARHQYLIKASEMHTFFGTTGGQIQGLALHISGLNSSAVLHGFTIKMGCTSIDSLTAYQENLLTVFNAKDVTPHFTENYHSFDQYFDWDGVSNIIVDICFTNTTGGSLNNQMLVTQTPYRSQFFTWNNTMSMCGISGAQPTTPAYTTYFQRPEITFSMCLFSPNEFGSLSWLPASGTNAPFPLGNDTTTAHPKTPQTYQVQISNAQTNCGAKAFVSVDVDTSSRLTLSSDTTICFGQPVSLLANMQGTPVAADYTYTWSASAGTAPPSGTGAAFAAFTVTPSQSTTYFCTVTGGRCPLFDSVIVTQAPNLVAVINQTDSIACFGNATARLQTVAAGGIAPYSYSWSPNVSTTAVANSLPAGTYSVTVSDSHSCTGTASKQITQPTQLTATVSALSPVKCYGESSGSLLANVSGGTPSYTFLWSNGGVTLNPNTGLAAGNYSVIVRDSKLCLTTASATLSQPPVLQAAITNTDSVICYGTNTGSATVSASGGAGIYSYTWSSGASATATNNSLLAGTGYVYVTDENLCKDTATFIIYQPTQLQMNIFPTPANCDSSNDGVITTNVWGGNSPYSYSWDGVAGASSHTGLSVGQHTVAVTDAHNCFLSKTANIDTLYRLHLSLFTSPAMCFGSADGLATVIPTNGSPSYQYQWSVAETGNVVNAPAGQISVSVTDVNNCSASATATISQPLPISITAGSQTPTCVGASNGAAWASARGGTPDYVYAWSSLANADTAQNLSSGVYQITVYDVNFCSATAAVTVGIPPALRASVAQTNISCFGSNDGTATVSVSGGNAPYSYVWDNADTSSHRTNLAPATYIVSVADSKGCDTVLQVLFTNPAPVSFAFLNADSVSCPQAQDAQINVGMAGGTPPYFYALNNLPFQNDSVFESLEVGVYTVKAHDANGCAIDTTLEIMGVPELQFEIQPQDTIIQFGEQVFLNVRTNNFPSYWLNGYSWTPSDGLSCDDCLNPTFWGYVGNTYILTINYGKNCRASDTVTIKVEDAVAAYIPNAFSPNGKGRIENETIRIFGKGVDSVEFRIFDRWGEKVFDATSVENAWDGTYKGEKQPPGVYVYDAVIYFLTGKMEQKHGSILLIR